MSGGKQHTTSQFLLRGFTDDNNELMKYDLRSRAFRSRPPSAVAWTHHHNTVTDSEGNPSSVIDDWIGTLENRAAPLIQRLRSGAYHLETAEVQALAEFVALQILRVPAAHQLWQETDESLDRLRPYIDGLTPAFRGKNGANAKMSLLVDRTWPEIVTRYALQVARFPPRSLVTSDVPVVLVPSPWWGSPVTVKSAGTIYMAISDSAALIYVNREHKPDASEFADVVANSETAVAINQAVVAQSQLQVFWHPDAEVDVLLGSAFEFPAFRDRVAPAHVDSQAEKIEQWAKWVAENLQEAAEYHSQFPSSSVAIPANARPLTAPTRRRLFGPGD